MENMQCLGKARTAHKQQLEPTNLPGSRSIHPQCYARRLTNKELLSSPLGYIVFRDFIYQAVLEWYFLLVYTED